ncbi:TRAF-like family protein [Citrus sinensis]|nr:TRAF-like family protein [Citrus sinensis]
MGDNAISREKRSLPPADYSLKIESFKLLSESTVESFESGVSNSGATIDDSNPHSDGTWNVNVYYKLFVYDQLSNQYLVVQDAKAPMRRFDRRKGEWGFGKFLDLATFNEPSNGYLVDESCVFGAEVYVIRSYASPNEPPNPTTSIKSMHGHMQVAMQVMHEDSSRVQQGAFGSVGDTVQRSGEFTVGERNWQLVVYPAGSGADRGNYLTVSLKLADYQKVTPKKPVYAEFKFKIPNQYSRNRAGAEQTVKYFFNSAAEKESSKILSRDDLYDTTKGYLPSNESLVVEVQFLVVLVIKANT